MPAVFSMRASPPCAHSRRFRELLACRFCNINRNRQMHGQGGFNRRGSISVLDDNTIIFNALHAPKLTAGVAGIESVCYDFPEGVLRTRDFFGYFLSWKESNVNGHLTDLPYQIFWHNVIFGNEVSVTSRRKSNIAPSLSSQLLSDR